MSEAWRLRSILAGVAAVLISACSSGTEAVEDPYLPDIRAALEEADTDFKRSVLSDLEISRPEYEEAVDRYVKCMDVAGYSVTPELQSNYFIFSAPEAQGFDDAEEHCRELYLHPIELLFVDRLTNPERLDSDELMATCLVKVGAAPATYDAAQWREDLESGFEAAPYSPDAEALDSCFANPTAAMDQSDK